MKIKVTVEDPGMLDYAVAEQAKWLNLPEDEAARLIAIRMQKEHGKMSKWFEYGEYLTVEFDTELMTATVLDAKEAKK